MKVHKKHIWPTLLGLYIIALAYLCLMKPDNMPEIKPDFWGIPVDKLAHFIMFAPYPVIAYGSFIPSGKKLRTHIAVLAAIFISGLGLAIGTEYLQGLSDYRSYDINDFYADAAGMFFSTIFVLIYIFIRKNRRER